MYLSPNVSGAVKLRHDAGGEGEVHRPTVNVAALHRDLVNCDDDWLIAYKDGAKFGWARFVYGNDGWDVISDYSVNLERYMKASLKIVHSYA
jgi:hypothetical protein